MTVWRCVGTAGLAMALVAASAASARAQVRHRELFQPQNLGQLEGPDRDLWQKPEQIMDALGIADRSVVADLGAGGGWFTIRLARRVGPSGIVFAQDVQPEMLEATSRRALKEGLSNVRPVLGTATDPKLPTPVDAVLIVDTYHEMDDPVALLANLRRQLKPSGRVGIVDYRKDGYGPGPPLEDRVDPGLIVRNAEAAGLRLLRRENFLPYQFLLVFGPAPVAPPVER